MTTGEKLRKLRGKKPRWQVAEEIGISENSLINYELDRRRPSDDVKVWIAEYYGYSVGFLFFDERTIRKGVK